MRGTGVGKLGPLIWMHMDGPSSTEKSMALYRDAVRETKREIARLKGITVESQGLDVMIELEVLWFFECEEKAAEHIKSIRARGVPEGLRNLLSTERKRDAERISEGLTIGRQDLQNLVMNCDQIGFTHRSSTREFIPSDTGDLTPPKVLSEEDGKLTREGQKHFKQVTRVFRERKRRTVHLFENKNAHHFFIFDFSDIEGSHSPHYGPHLHYASHLWNIDKEDTFGNFEKRDFRPSTVHIRIDWQRED